MDQLPNLGREHELLESMGLSSMDELFSDIPAAVRRDGPLPLRPAQSEEEIWRDAQHLLGRNISLLDRPSFLGAGLHRNFVPSMVPMLATRGEFLTAYTPYQPEVSQGMLQAMWEFQTMISELTGLPIANASMYDMSTAAAEAITNAVRVHNRRASQPNVVHVSQFVPPDRWSVIENYTQGGGIEVRMLPHTQGGLVDLEAAAQAEGACAVYVEQPNAFGMIDDRLRELKALIGPKTALIVGADVVSLGLLEPPGHWGADIVVGEGQPFGIGPTGGGPIYGIYACTKEYLRQMPGRIVGRTVDADGMVAFCLTLSTREQHIRRHRATSNICSNETLIALMGAIHMAMLGPEGVELLALRTMAASEATKRAVLSIDGVELLDPGTSTFREFAVLLPGPAVEAITACDAAGVTAGFDMGRWWSHVDRALLISADAHTTAADIEALQRALAEWMASVVQEVAA